MRIFSLFRELLLGFAKYLLSLCQESRIPIFDFVDCAFKFKKKYIYIIINMKMHLLRDSQSSVYPDDLIRNSYTDSTLSGLCFSGFVSVFCV